MEKLLLIEDDPTLSRNIRESLAEESWTVEPVFDGLIAEKLLQRNTYDCVIIDINLPGKNGFDVCRDFRQRNKHTPVLMLTAFGELDDKVAGYESGADDYLTKPFFMKELVLRVAALLKRSAHAPMGTGGERIVVDDIAIDTGSKRVTRQGKEVPLTPREYQILLKLLRRKGQVVPKKELVSDIWGSSVDINTNTVEVYINFLRNKLDKPFGRQSIKTKIGFGYYFDSK